MTEVMYSSLKLDDDDGSAKVARAEPDGNPGVALSSRLHLPARGVVRMEHPTSRPGHEPVLYAAGASAPAIVGGPMKPPKVLYRTLEFDRAAATDDGIPVVVSSVTPVPRDGYLEVLDHGPEAIDLSRAPLPLIESHDSARVNIGLVDGLRPVGGVMRGIAKFGKSARARELLEDVKGGIVRSLSVAYKILSHRVDGDTVTATRWMPFEVSIVAVPADATAGFYRNHQVENSEMVGRDLNGGEADRVKAIYNMGNRFKQPDLARQFVDSGRTVQAFQDAVLERMGGREAPTVISDLGLVEELGKREFSFVKLARYLANPTDRTLRRDAGFELEVCGASDKGEGVRVPHEVLSTRVLSKASTTSGAKLVGTDHLDSSFIEMLRNALVVRQAGATFLDGLQGDAMIPRQTGGSTFYYVDEGNDVSESTPTFDQVPLTPHTVGTFVDVTRRLLIQSAPGVEQLVRADFANGIANAIDSTAMFGNPSITAQANRPRGVAYTSGIGSVSLGTNGAAPTRPTLISLKREVAVDNAATGRLAFVTNSKALAKLETTLLDAGSGRYVYEGDGILLGKPVWESNAVPSDLTKGGGSALSAILYGDWSQLIVGTWSGIDILSDPYTLGKSGGLRLIVLQDFDCAVRQPSAFAACLDATTVI